MENRDHQNYTLNEVVVESIETVQDTIPFAAGEARLGELSLYLECQDYNCHAKSLKVYVYIDDHCPLNALLREYTYTDVRTEFTFDFDRDLADVETSRIGTGGLDYDTLAINLDDAIDIASEQQKNQSSDYSDHFIYIGLLDRWRVAFLPRLGRNVSSEFRFEIDYRTGDILEPVAN
ncbi:MAG: hypothetical protein F9K46_00125 [Anaerolineae bacterium]|nr:MAG: hypothetical protein F9K46_00125 [Anaerolineae bacterium]